MAIVECGINAVLYNKKPYVSSLNHLLRFKKQSTNHALVSGHLVIFAKSPVTKTCIRRLQIHLELWKAYLQLILNLKKYKLSKDKNYEVASTFDNMYSIGSSNRRSF
ncbi:hypothetical protein T06_1462 [Trichinella sp. T6]|nr:hypothetical protein T06_1462 [Trichinella sp. T6]